MLAMLRSAALTLEVIALGLLPTLALGFVLLILEDALKALPMPFIDAAVLPWFVLCWAGPATTLLGAAGWIGIQHFQDSRASRGSVEEIFVSRQ
jgi:hypothetical protein